MEERCRKPTLGVWVHLVAAWSEYEGMMMMKWCLMSSDVSWHIRDKLWPMRSTVQQFFTSTETRRLVRTDSPGRPPRLSHSSWTMMKAWFRDRLYIRRAFWRGTCEIRMYDLRWPYSVDRTLISNHWLTYVYVIHLALLNAHDRFCEMHILYSITSSQIR